MPLLAPWRALGVLFALGLPALPAAAQTACKFAKVDQWSLRWVGPGMQPGVEGSINGVPRTMLVDTGATHTALTREATRRHNLTLAEGEGYFAGSGGLSSRYTAQVDDMRYGTWIHPEPLVPVVGEQTSEPGYAALIGADRLLQYDLEIHLAQKQLRFFRAEHCAKAYLGYWDKDAIEVPLIIPGSFDPRPHVQVKLNGLEVLALLDTGATHSFIAGATARKLKLAQPASLGKTDGIGVKAVASWPTRVDFQLGDEVVKAAPMIVNEGGMGTGTGMVLGQDWLRAHRVLLARSQQRMIFSYLGGLAFQPREAAPWFLADAKAGDASAQFRLAQLSRDNGDVDSARHWLGLAAEQGHPEAVLALADHLAAGGDDQAAAALLGRVAQRKQGDPYVALYAYLTEARARGRDAAQRTLAASPALGAVQWPRPLLDYFLGKIDRARLLALSGKGTYEQCEAQRFAGELEQAHAPAAARQPLMAALDGECTVK